MSARNTGAEPINLADSMLVGRGAPTSVAERLGLTGVYDAVCRGAKDAHAREYARGLEELTHLRSRADGIRNDGQGWEFGALRSLLQHIDALTNYLHTLTEVKWQATAPNVVTTTGANAALDAALSGSSYTAACYMGLIGAVGYTGPPVIGDTMASHPTWTEAGTTNAPTYTGPRKSISWAAAANKSKSPASAPVFTITGAGTAKGVFITFGTGAVSTIMSTAGVLYSAGLFIEGDQVVAATNTLTVNYTTSA